MRSVSNFAATHPVSGSEDKIGEREPFWEDPTPDLVHHGRDGVHAWFEGGIENYDRGQMNGRKPRPLQ